MDIIQALIQAGNTGKPVWRIVNNNGAFEVVNNRSSNIFTILNNGTIGISSNVPANFLESYSNVNVLANYTGSVSTDVVVKESVFTSNYVFSTSNILVNRINRVPIPWTSSSTSNLYNLSCNIGIGTTNPAAKLHIIGGDIVCSGNVSSYYSDERLKTKTADIINPLEIVDKLKGFYYIPNALAYSNGITHTTQEIGLSAQDVQRVLPEIVEIAPFDLARDEADNKVSKTGENYLTISYERLAPVFVEAIKELKRENNVLNEKYDNLLRKVEKLSDI